MTKPDGHDLTDLTPAELNDLAAAVKDEMQKREEQDRVALEDRVRATLEKMGLDPDQIRFRKPRTRKARKTNGADEHA